MQNLQKKLGLISAEQKVQLSKNIDLSKLKLNAEEGFLLSRLEAGGTIAEILQMSSFSKEQTLAMLEKFADQKFIVAAAMPVKGAKRPEGAAKQAPVSVPEEFKEVYETFQFLSAEDPAVHTLLGISKYASPKDAKKAFFEFSKKFHPDRLSRRGASAEVLKWGEFIVLKTDQLLQKMQEKPKDPNKFKGFFENLNKQKENIDKAKVLLSEAQKSMGADPTAASSTLKIILTFDPENAEAKRLLETLESRVAGKQAKDFLKKALALEEVLAYTEAGEQYEQAVMCDPKNPLLHRTCAEFFFKKLKDPRRALRYILQLLVYEPKKVENHLLHGDILAAMSREIEALQVFENVLKLDKNNVSAKNKIAGLKKK